MLNSNTSSIRTAGVAHANIATEAGDVNDWSNLKG